MKILSHFAFEGNHRFLYKGDPKVLHKLICGEDEADGHFLADGTRVMDKDGNRFVPTTETIAAGGTSTALDLTKFHHDIDADAGGDIFTLADGVVGQEVLIVLKTATGVATITPATFLGGTSITLDAIGDSVRLYFGANGWQIAGGNSYAIV